MLRQLAFVVSLLILSSCAAVFADKTRSVMVTSNPPGAEITIDGQPHGVTPVRIAANDHKLLAISIRKDGYHNGGCFLNTKTRAKWVILDVLLIWTVVPIIVDLVTNSWSTLESEFCTVNLLPLDG